VKGIAGRSTPSSGLVSDTIDVGHPSPRRMARAAFVAAMFATAADAFTPTALPSLRRGAPLAAARTVRPKVRLSADVGAGLSDVLVNNSLSGILTRASVHKVGPLQIGQDQPADEPAA